MLSKVYNAFCVVLIIVAAASAPLFCGVARSESVETVKISHFLNR